MSIYIWFILDKKRERFLTIRPFMLHFWKPLQAVIFLTARLFASLTEDLEQVRKDNCKCLELLATWLSQFPENYDNPNLQLHHNGEGLTKEFLNKPRSGAMPQGGDATRWIC